MEKEEMKRVLLNLATEAEKLNPLLRQAEEYSVPFEVLKVLTEGVPFWDYRTVSFSENIRVACMTGQLTQREMPDKSGVFVSIEVVKGVAESRNQLAEMPYDKVQEIFDGYDEFLPLAQKIKVCAENFVQKCVETVAVMEQYIGETKKEPFKESWEGFSNGLDGLSQTLDSVVKHYGNKNEWASLVIKSVVFARELSESLKVLGQLYKEGEPVTAQVNRVIEILQEATNASSKASDELGANATYEVRETFGYLTEKLKNMSEII